MLDISKVTSIADYFVICSADSPRQLNAIADEVEAALRPHGVRTAHREGTDASGWVLLDFGDLVVHVFSRAQRAYYDLDAAWDKAPQLVHMQ